MTRTITKGATTITPAQVLGYETEWQSRNIAHDVLSAVVQSTSLRDDTLRAGTLRLLFLTEADAIAARVLHSTAGVFTLADDVLTSIQMLYVRDGRMRLTLDQDSSSLWILEVGYREVLA